MRYIVVRGYMDTEERRLLIDSPGGFIGSFPTEQLANQVRDILNNSPSRSDEQYFVEEAPDYSSAEEFLTQIAPPRAA